MTVDLAYGKHSIEVQLPDGLHVDVVEPTFSPGLPDPSAAIRAALQAPIGAPPLRGMVRSSDKVGIVFSDITRPTPYDLILPAIFSELAHVPVENVVLFNATGTHRPNTKEELAQVLGPDIVGTYRIVQNDCTDRDSHALVGRTRAGNDIWLLREFLECDVHIPTGFIEPHFFAGFSGGGKAIMPGLALLETIERNHSPKHLDSRNSRWGILEGNPLWEEIEEAASLVPSRFLLNVALNRRKEITAVFAGDAAAAHAEGCAFVRERAMVAVPEPYDIVITSNSGHPLDLNMYQSVKGMSAASQVVKEGGDIIIAAECWDGIPEHGEYGRLLRSAASPAELLRAIREPGFMVQDMWEAQIHANICTKANVHFYSDNLSDAQITEAFMSPCHDITARVTEIVALGEKSSRNARLTEGNVQPRVCVLPEGPQTIPYIDSPA